MCVPLFGSLFVTRTNPASTYAQPNDQSDSGSKFGLVSIVHIEILKIERMVRSA